MKPLKPPLLVSFIGPLLLLVSLGLACNFTLDQSAEEAIDKEIDAVGQAQPTSSPQPSPTEQIPPTATTSDEGNVARFCAIYAEFVTDASQRADAIASNQGDTPNETPYLEAEDAAERFIDQLAPIAPPELRSTVEALADMSLRGLVSTQEGLPEAEPLFERMDAYAEVTCGISLGGEETD